MEAEAGVHRERRVAPAVAAALAIVVALSGVIAVAVFRRDWMVWIALLAPLLVAVAIVWTLWRERVRGVPPH